MLQRLHHLPKMATSGKAYGSRSSHDRLIVSLSILGDLSPVMQVETVVLSQVAKNRPIRSSATRSILLGKTLTGGTILSALSSCVRLDSLCAMSFSRLECVGLQSPVSWNTRSGFPIEGHKEGLTSSPPPPPPPPSFIQATTVVLSVVMTAILFNQMSWHS